MKNKESKIEAVQYGSNSTGNLKIRRLSGRECLYARSLWEEVFDDEEPAFTDYYFEEMAPKNRGLVLEEDGQIISMLYLSPNEMVVNGQECRCSYIIGVATRKERRHRGCMAALLREAYAWMAEEEEPFAFLMPASPAIYEPFGFRYIFDRPEWDGKRLDAEMTELSGEYLEEAAVFASDYLKKNSGVYVKRTKDYYERMQRELRAQSGAVCGKSENGTLKGVALITREGGETEVQELLAEHEWETCIKVRKKEKTPIIMARLISLPKMLSLVRASEQCHFVFRIKDKEISENDGLFSWSVGVEQSSAERTDSEEPGQYAAITAENLIQWVFGYALAEDCFELNWLTQIQKNDFLQKMELLILPKPVWITEIV